MRRLVLVRHGPPQRVEGVAAREWQLSERGRETCENFFSQLVAPDAARIQIRPSIIASSVEPKAVQTAEIIARPFGLSVETVTGLHEHDRSNLSYLDAPDFSRKVADFLAQPDELVMGLETANQALHRFTQAVEGVCNRTLTGDVVIVSHGTVMTLYLAPRMNRDPFLFWQKLGMPALFLRPLPD